MVQRGMNEEIMQEKKHRVCIRKAKMQEEELIKKKVAWVAEGYSGQEI